MRTKKGKITQSSLKSKSFKYIFLVCLSVLYSSAFARDINLDEIYIKRSSPLLKKLIFQKLDTYAKVNAVLVDRNVIYSGWISGDYILYIKESPVANVNIIYKYHARRQKNEEIYRVKGHITHSHISWNGRYIFLKRLIQKNKENSPWHKSYPGMGLKTVIKGLFRSISISPDLKKAVATDDYFEFETPIRDVTPGTTPQEVKEKIEKKDKLEKKEKVKQEDSPKEKDLF